MTESGSAVAFGFEARRIHDAAKRAVARYDGSWFEDQLNKVGGLALAQRLLDAPQPQRGFTDMLLAGHPELTVEYLVLLDEWRGLFSEKQRRAARERLGRFAPS